jgi:hypothetical protein
MSYAALMVALCSEGDGAGKRVQLAAELGEGLHALVFPWRILAKTGIQAAD